MLYDAAQSEPGSLSQSIHVWRVGEGQVAAASRPWRTERGWMSIPHCLWMKASPSWAPIGRLKVTWRGSGCFLLCGTMRHAVSDKRPLSLRQTVNLYWGLALNRAWIKRRRGGGAGWIHSRERRMAWMKAEEGANLEDIALKQQSQQITSMNEAFNRPGCNRKHLFLHFVIFMRRGHWL